MHAGSPAPLRTRFAREDGDGSKTSAQGKVLGEELAEYPDLRLGPDARSLAQDRGGPDRSVEEHDDASALATGQGFLHARPVKRSSFPLL